MYRNITYGGSAYAYFMDYKMPDFKLKEWENIVKNFYAKYHGLSRWHDTLCEGIYRNKGIITVPTGLRFKAPLDKKKDGSIETLTYSETDEIIKIF